MFIVKEIKDAKVWNDFLLNQPTQAGIFLQSWPWLDFQESLGNKVWRLGIERKGGVSLLGICGLVKNQLPFSKSYFYSPRGPIFAHNFQASEYREIFETARDYIIKIAPSEKALFLRFEPMTNLAPLPRPTGGYGAGNPIEATSLHTHSGRYLISHGHETAQNQPKQTLISDLLLDENVLFSQMHEKTRYNIRLALRHGVKVQSAIRQPADKMQNDFDSFWKLLQGTAKRDRFKTHSQDYYRKMMETLGGSSPTPLKVRGGEGGVMNVQLWLAYVKEEVVAGAIVAYFGDTATYLHGASSYVHRNLMAPNLLHWEIMKAAKQEGYKKYDFWGIDEKKWPGLTRFKKGFANTASPGRSVGSGHIINYPGTFDLPINKFWYKLYRLGRMFV
ncbi:MAG: peptidoglycan bridge formation glycyltransferase FemA/FemB family protein [bacterium]|nr:peptidoglycan bridge formation glycyltransferase FemA/FemB family protein [bacterium]